MAQNTSNAVMASNMTPKGSASYFPTPPWALRAMIEAGGLGDPAALKGMTAWEPACGEGHMAEALKEYFGKVTAPDLYDYGYGLAGYDFLSGKVRARAIDVVA